VQLPAPFAERMIEALTRPGAEAIDGHSKSGYPYLAHQPSVDCELSQDEQGSANPTPQAGVNRTDWGRRIWKSALPGSKAGPENDAKPLK
jgi:hypothetical protein